MGGGSEVVRLLGRCSLGMHMKKGQASAIHSQVYLKSFDHKLRLTPNTRRIRQLLLNRQPLTSVSTPIELPHLQVDTHPHVKAMAQKHDPSLRFNAIPGCARELRNEIRLIIRPQKPLTLRRLHKDLFFPKPAMQWENTAKLLASKELRYQEHIKDTYAEVYSERRSTN